MKIIGHTKEGYILDCTFDELANLFLEKHHYDLSYGTERDNYGHSRKHLSIGTEVPIKQHFGGLLIAKDMKRTLGYVAERHATISRDLNSLMELLAIAQQNAKNIGQPEIEQEVAA